MRSKIGYAITAICVAFDIWIFASWVNIVLHNTHPNPVYWSFNFFTLFF